MPTETDKVFFGATVTLEDEQGHEQKYQIVGPDEFDLTLGKLSMDSPLAKAMLGKRLDDEIAVHSPSGQQYFCITHIHYQLN